MTRNAQASHLNSNEKSQASYRHDYRKNGGGAGPETNVTNFSNLHDSREMQHSNWQSNSMINNKGAVDTSYTYSKFQPGDTFDKLNASQPEDARTFSINESRIGFDAKSYQGSQIQEYRSRERQLGGNPYYDNRSPSPSIKVSNQAVNVTDFGRYNPITNGRDPKPNPLLQPESMLLSVLDEVEDEFRLNIFKLKSEQGSYGIMI